MVVPYMKPRVVGVKPPVAVIVPWSVAVVEEIGVVDSIVRDGAERASVVVERIEPVEVPAEFTAYARK